jgi:hypothetical protein
MTRGQRAQHPKREPQLAGRRAAGRTIPAESHADVDRPCGPVLELPALQPVQPRQPRGLQPDPRPQVTIDAARDHRLHGLQHEPHRVVDEEQPRHQRRRPGQLCVGHPRGEHGDQVPDRERQRRRHYRPHCLQNHQ